jgi:hypothetical protein
MELQEMMQEDSSSESQRTKMEFLSYPGIALGFYLWFRSYRALFKARQFRPNKLHRILFAVLPLVCTMFIAVVLLICSSPDVRSNSGWITFYIMGGVAWLQFGLFLLSLFGVSAREDVVERQNPSAAWVVYGAVLGTTACYAGANIGSGPGAEVVLLCAILSTTFLFVFWSVLERIFRLADQVTIERDESSGIRIGGWIFSLGLIFGGAVAGNWESLQGTILDFLRYGWIALFFLLAAVAIERVLRSLRRRKKSDRGASVVIAFAYSLAAIIYVAWRAVH